MKFMSAIIAMWLAGVLLSGCAATPGRVSQTTAVAALNLRQGVAVRGYDPVAYFEADAPVTGNPAITYQWNGATWRFATAAHREAFIADPQRYAPQFGGYCAYAVSRGTTADADPGQWAIVDGRLFLNNNAFAKKLWDQDRPGNITAGDANWPLISKYPLGGTQSP